MRQSTLSTKEPILGKHTLPLGFGNFVSLSKIVAVCNPNSSPAKISRRKAAEQDRIINVCHGRPMRAIILTESNHVILTAVSCETLQSRMEAMNGKS